MWIAIPPINLTFPVNDFASGCFLVEIQHFFKLGGNDATRSSQQQGIICELSEIDVFHSSCNIKTQQILMKSTMFELKAKSYFLNGIQKRGERTTLPKSS